MNAERSGINQLGRIFWAGYAATCGVAAAVTTWAAILDLINRLLSK
jgi:hypothetical protein